jgi:hypothetical protein
MVYWFDFVYSPPGFYGKDIVIDVISAIVVILIGFFSFRNFLMDKKNKKQLFISLAFLLLGASFAVKIITNMLTHNNVLIQNQFPFFGASYSFTLLSAIGFLTHAFLTLFGFYILYALTSKDTLTMNYIIIAYFILISTYFARFNYYLFYVTAFLFLAASTRRYFLSYSRNRYRNTRRLAISFAIISLSQLFFMFANTTRTLYIIAEVIQLLGYCFLLFTFVMVLKNAAKQKD